MWLGEQITERGIGNGISSLSSPVLSRDSRQPLPILSRSASRRPALPRVAVGCSISISVTFFVVFVERGQRRIVVNYRNVSKVVVSMLHRAHIYR